MRYFTDSEIPPALNPRRAEHLKTLPPPSIDRWLAAHPPKSALRSPSGTLTLRALGYVDA